MKCFHTLLLIAAASYAFAQPAPDFTATTSTGQTIHLYQDYLNQGKTVVLKLFFTTCPPCNAMAPLMEPFYQSWGGGDGDVEFISLSIMSFDNNLKVNTYKQLYGHTFPGVGSQGGSLTAITPYTNGTYGQFLGTPTFIVIAPNGSVRFDPRGANAAATLDSVDVAIQNTGAERPPVSYTATGKVTFGTGTEGVAGVVIGIEGVDEALDTTDAEGNFNFTIDLSSEATYTLTASKDVHYRNGISNLDVIQIRRHILNLQLFDTAYEMLAADINGDQDISVLDIVLLTQVILVITDHPGMGDPSWIFVDAGFNFSSPDLALAQYYDGQARLEFRTDTTEPLLLIGIKKGDVNQSANAGE